jgi:hypothetical protein
MYHLQNLIDYEHSLQSLVRHGNGLKIEKKAVFKKYLLAFKNLRYLD